MRYIIHFESTTTGYRGKGTHPVSKDIAEAWVDRMNTNYPDIKHWYEEASNG